MLNVTNKDRKDESQRSEEIDSMRRRMLRELESFLSKAINRPFPRLRIITPPRMTNRCVLSMN